MIRNFKYFFLLFSLIFVGQVSTVYGKHKKHAPKVHLSPEAQSIDTHQIFDDTLTITTPAISTPTISPTPSPIITSNSEDNALPTGKVLFITGSCSSGKSSMARILAQRLNAKYFAFDEYVMPLVLKKFIEKHYGKFLAFFVNKFVMRNFFSTVSFLSEKKKYALQIKFYNDLKDGLAIEPTSKMYREVKKLAMQGRNVVVESPIYLWEGVDCLSSLPELEGADVTYVLAYCSWADVVNRIKQRNSSRHKKIHRELDWALINFMHTFEVSPKYHGDDFLEYTSGKIAHKIIAEYSQPKYKKMRMKLLKETQDVVLKGFPTDSAYYIYPKFKYDIIVNTKTHSPEQGAAFVLKSLEQK